MLSGDANEDARHLGHNRGLAHERGDQPPAISARRGREQPQLTIELGEDSRNRRRIHKHSWRWTGTSRGQTIPSRTLSLRISTTVMMMSSLMIMLSFFLRLITSIGADSFLGRSEPRELHGSEQSGRPECPVAMLLV